MTGMLRKDKMDSATHEELLLAYLLTDECCRRDSTRVEVVFKKSVIAFA